jgi:hypothetical protein
MQVDVGLDELQSYDSAHDLSGFSVRADRPIALFVETEWRRPHSSETETFIASQMPQSQWGCSYLDAVPAETNAFSLYRITGKYSILSRTMPQPLVFEEPFL